jgi:hypothetical protein
MESNTLTILFLLPSAIVALLVPVPKGVLSVDVCLQEKSANIMLIFATYLFS